MPVARSCQNVRGPKVASRSRPAGASRASVAAGSASHWIVAAVIVQVELLDVRDDHLRVRHARAGAGRHLLGEVDRDDPRLREAGAQERRERAGAAAELQDAPRLPVGARYELGRQPLLDARVRIVGRGRPVEAAADPILV
jgi:hypothetical protein